jgi:hypothetical protein
MHPTTIRRLALLLLAATTLPAVGCLAAGLVVAGAAAAGAGTYTYMQGRLVRDYPAGYQETLTATQASLAELGFPILKTEGAGHEITLTTKTTTGVPVTVDLTTRDSPIPSEGSVTRVGVRVGWTGDEDASEKILAQIAVHVVPAARGPRPGAAPGALQPVAVTGVQPVPQGQLNPIRVVEQPGAARTQPATWKGTP